MSKKTLYVALSTIVLFDELEGTKRIGPKEQLPDGVSDEEIKRLLDKKAIIKADDLSARNKARQKVVDARTAAAEAEAEAETAEQQAAAGEAESTVSADEVPGAAGAGGTTSAGTSGNPSSGRTTSGSKR